MALFLCQLEKVIETVAPFLRSERVKNKISKSIGIINKIRNSRILYFTFIYPYLIYCIEIWGNTNDTHLNPIVKIPQKSIQAISFAHYLDGMSPLFKRLNILNLKKLVIQRIALLMFKYDKGVLPHPINNLFSVNNERHNYNTRHTHDLQINTGNGEIVYTLVSLHGVHIWNHISKKIPTDVSYACFKNLEKCYLTNNDILYRIQ